MGRRIRTNLDLLKETEKPIQIRDSKMEFQFNDYDGAKKITYNVGERIFAKLYKQNKFEWFPGIIKRKIGNVNYAIKIDNIPEFRAIRSHSNQLRPRYVNSKQSAQLPVSILLYYFNLSPQSNQTSEISISQVDPDLPEQTQRTPISESFQQEVAADNSSEAQIIQQAPSTTPAVEQEASTSATFQGSVVVRRSNRLKRPPVWAPEYHIPKRKGDVRIPKVPSLD
ncbi:uncharacterized protein LOC142221656 [Haematobia irritans]|uniref:uncharacterized protein LOC142221656 n=1 Tax=Haematobia irritans TaxID=7368 RepID=UPI003F4F6E08